MQIIGAPSFFPTVWGWIKKWFDPITTSKIFILGTNDVKPTLSAFIDVANIPKKYGGELDFECGMLPVLDPAVLRVLTLSSPDQASTAPMFFAAPVRWVDGDDGDLIALGVGSIDGQPRREKLATLHSQVVQSAFPGLSRQNTRNVIEPVASTTVPPLPTAVDGPASSTAPAPNTGPIPYAVPGSSPVAYQSTQSGLSSVPISSTAPVPAHAIPLGSNAAQLPPTTVQGTAATFAPPPVSSATVSTVSQPPPVQAQPAPLTIGSANAGPGPISLPPQALPNQLQRSGTEYFTPAVDTSELKRL